MLFFYHYRCSNCENAMGSLESQINHANNMKEMKSTRKKLVEQEVCTFFHLISKKRMKMHSFFLYKKPVYKKLGLQRAKN